MNFAQSPIPTQSPIVEILSSAADIGLQYFNLKQVKKLQVSFQRRLDTDAEKIDYINNMVSRLTSEAIRFAEAGRVQPGIPEFDKTLALLVKNDIIYRGNCNADILAPVQNDKEPRKVWASISRSGSIKPPTQLTPEVGVIWAGGCKEAEYQARIAYNKGIKTGLMFKAKTVLLGDLSALDIFMRVGGGLLLVVGFILLLKTQNVVIEEEKSFKFTRKKKVKPGQKRYKK